MKTRAAVLHEIGLPAPYAESKPLKIETLELDEPENEEVLIRIGAVGLCHSDLSVINGSRPRPTPMALGHEATGEIIALDINSDKFDIAKQLGATSVYDSSKSGVVDQIQSATSGGLDHVFETAGAIPAMEVAYQITKRGGTTATTGLPDPEQEFSFSQVTLAAQERTVKGSYVAAVFRQEIYQILLNFLNRDVCRLNNCCPRPFHWMKLTKDSTNWRRVKLHGW